MKYDVLVVGAGPAGLTAATILADRGASVIVVDEQPAPGGQIWRGIGRNQTSPVFAALGPDYAKGLAVAQAFEKSGATYLPSTQVWQIEDGWEVFVTTDGKASRLSTRTILLANGAQERPVPFPGWTLPGVMTVGAAQILLKSGGMLPQGKVWLAGAGPLSLLYATQLLNLDGQIAGFLDTSGRPSAAALRHLPKAWRDLPSIMKGLRWTSTLKRLGKMQRNVSDISASGDQGLERVEWSSNGKRQTAEADVLLVHEGIVPRIHETLALGCEHTWNNTQKYLAPKLNKWRETSREGLFVAGDAGGIGGWQAATVSGEIAALGLCRHLDLLPSSALASQLQRKTRAFGRSTALRPFLDAMYPPPQAPIANDVVACRCEEVTAGQVRDVARYSAPDPGAIKAATRCGMGPCQGRQCGYTIQALIAEVHGKPTKDVSFFNIRPPLKPITLGELAMLDVPEEAE